MPYIDPSRRPTYSPEQVQKYFERINLPQKYRTTTASGSANVEPTTRLELLSKLIRYQLTSIPFENLDLHYSIHHAINIDPTYIFQKIVEQDTGRGGYCMENTNLLATVLRSLGYQVMLTGARVNEALGPLAAGKGWTGPKFNGWNHMVAIVTIDGKKYLADVGLGSNGPTFPVPLEEGFSAVNVKGEDACGGHSMILRREHIPDNTHRTNPEQLLWTYSLRFNNTMDWLPGYCFSEVEFLPRDFEAMNFFVSKSPSSWFTYDVVALLFVKDDEDNIIGDITLFRDEIKERRYGKSRELCAITSEAERIEALEKYLGIKLSQLQRAGIGGRPSHIP